MKFLNNPTQLLLTLFLFVTIFSCKKEISDTSPQDEALVDPLRPGISLEPFFQLMADERVVKVFHAARQDLGLGSQIQLHHLARLAGGP